MNTKTFTWGLVLALGLSVISGCGVAPSEPTTGLANPASVYCEERGYSLEMRADADGGTYGVCKFPDGSECEEWAFYRGKCEPAGVSEVMLEATSAVESPAEEKSTASPEPVPTEVSAGQRDVVYEGVSFTLERAIATDFTAEIIPATDEQGPPMEPFHVGVAFNGYTLPDTFHQPRVLVYPVAELEAISEHTARTVTDLQQLLVDRPAAPKAIPFLPPFHAGQMLRAQVMYVDFQNGRGVRFLTQYAQAYLPINNHELFYTFQGLTDDGSSYVAAILPVSYPSLPADQAAYAGDLDALVQDFDPYIAQIEEKLDASDASSFTPDLSRLDSMIKSLAVAPDWTAVLPQVAEGEIESGIEVTGAVMDVLLSARVIVLQEPVEGFDFIALTEESELVSMDWDGIALRDITAGMTLEASGKPGESRALLARRVRLLEPLPTSPDVPVRRSCAEAADMILDYLRDQKPDLNPDVHIRVEELPVPEVWDSLQVQLFRVTDGPFANESFLIGNAGVLPVGTAIGGRGVTSFEVSDLDRDCNAELLFTYSFGSGIHQSRIGMYAPAYLGDRTYEATTGYLGDLDLVKEDMSTVRVRVVESDDAASTLRYRDTLGRLAIDQHDGAVELVLQLSDDLPDDVNQKVFHAEE